MKFLVFVFAALALFSCQKEENRIIVGEGQLDKASAITRKIQRLTANNTGIDNVIDSTDCYSVKLPVDVIVSGQTVSVQNADDYTIVSEILQATPVGATVDFVFPITVVDSAYVETVVGGEEFDALVSNCTAFQKIECLALVYPISVSAYDTGTQNPLNQTIDNDKEFYLFLENLPNSSVYQINYPISAVDFQGATISISSNEALNSAIDTAGSDCACDNPQILTDDLILYMPFANEIADLTGFGSVDQQGVTFVTDRSDNPNGAVSLGGGGQSGSIFVSGNLNNDLIQNNAFTISLWFNRQTSVLTPEFLLSNSEFVLGLGNPNIQTEVRSPFASAPNMFVNEADWPFLQGLDQWHHVAVTWNGQVFTLYRDANFVAESANPEFPQQMLGYAIGGEYLGFIDDIRVYKRSLNSTEIGTLFELEGDINTCLE